MSSWHVRRIVLHRPLPLGSNVIRCIATPRAASPSSLAPASPQSLCTLIVSLCANRGRKGMESRHAAGEEILDRIVPFIIDGTPSAEKPHQDWQQRVHIFVRTSTGNTVTLHVILTGEAEGRG